LSELFLLDTSIISEFLPGRSPIPPKVSTWLGARSPRFHLSTITITEIERGIALLAAEGGTRRSGTISTWLDDILDEYGDRIIDFDARAARSAGQISAAATAKGTHPGFADVAIAATASIHDLIILTRNLKHFIPLGVPCTDPFKAEAR